MGLSCLLNAAPLETVERRARRLFRRIKKTLAPYCDLALIRTESRVGGGALPEQGLASKAVSLAPKTLSVNELEEKLRFVALPVIGRIEEDRFLLDMRTVADDEVPLLAASLQQAFEGEQE